MKNKWVRIGFTSRYTSGKRVAPPPVRSAHKPRTSPQVIQVVTLVGDCSITSEIVSASKSICKLARISTVDGC